MIGSTDRWYCGNSEPYDPGIPELLSECLNCTENSTNAQRVPESHRDVPELNSQLQQAVSYQSEPATRAPVVRVFL